MAPRKPKETPEQRQALFEKFAIEIGFWKIVAGQVTENPEYGFEERKSLEYKFQLWLKKAEDAKKPKKVSRR